MAADVGVPDLDVPDPRASGGGGEGRRQDLEERRLPAAVGTEEPEELPGADFEADAVEGDPLSVEATEGVDDDFNDRLRRRSRA
jgi:hypothetical protein